MSLTAEEVPVKLEELPTGGDDPLAEVDLDLPAEPSAIKGVRDTAHTVAACTGCSKEDDLVLAFDEVAVNALKAILGLNADACLHLTVQLFCWGILAVVPDPCPDWDAPPAPGIIGGAGLGMSVIEAVVDQLFWIQDGKSGKRVGFIIRCNITRMKAQRTVEALEKTAV